jgi:drug/metabolite transporter superfamily protein YnfA
MIYAFAAYGGIIAAVLVWAWMFNPPQTSVQD